MIIPGTFRIVFVSCSLTTFLLMSSLLSSLLSEFVAFEISLPLFSSFCLYASDFFNPFHSLHMNNGNISRISEIEMILIEQVTSATVVMGYFTPWAGNKVYYIFCTSQISMVILLFPFKEKFSHWSSSQCHIDFKFMKSSY